MAELMWRVICDGKWTMNKGMVRPRLMRGARLDKTKLRAEKVLGRLYWYYKYILRSTCVLLYAEDNFSWRDRMHVQTGLHSSWHDVSVDASRVDVLGRALPIQLLLSVKLAGQ